MRSREKRSAQTYRILPPWAVYPTTRVDLTGVSNVVAETDA